MSRSAAGMLCRADQTDTGPQTDDVTGLSVSCVPPVPATAAAACAETCLTLLFLRAATSRLRCGVRSYLLVAICCYGNI